ncbi:MAG: GNAT family N-acetyltransferase [Simkaniaceae bacterium]|nr:GNAT family N-acetyltransferase [Simkaniaceae bacterium]
MIKYLYACVACLALNATSIEILEELGPNSTQFANLCHEAFAQPPYSYEPDLEYEAEYLKFYENSDNSIFILAKEGEEIVGAITGIPVAESFDECREAFEQMGVDYTGMYYLGELVIKTSHQEKGIGSKLYDAFEKFAREKGYRSITACTLVNGEKYFMDRAIQKRGFKRIENFVVPFEWKNIGADEITMHPMQFWVKEL